jgi:hypothetical protein
MDRIEAKRAYKSGGMRRMKRTLKSSRNVLVWKNGKSSIKVSTSSPQKAPKSAI